LRDRALERIGPVEWALRTTRFVREDLSEDILKGPGELGVPFESAIPAILLQGTVVDAETRRRATGVQIIAVDERFARVAPNFASWGVDSRECAPNETLARELDVGKESTLVVYFEGISDIPRETAIGRRDEVVDRLRLDVASVLPDEGAALFDLRNQQAAPKNLFVSLSFLQRIIERKGRVNTLLFVPREEGKGSAVEANFVEEVQATWSLEDLALRLREDAERNYVSLESEAFLLDDAVVDNARLASARVSAERLESLTYIVNSIDVGDRDVPYSLVSAVGDWLAADGRTKESIVPKSSEGVRPVVLNDWARQRLGASDGATTKISYYAVLETENLEEREGEFRYVKSVPLAGEFADRGWTPDYPGISDADTFGEWNAPFEIEDSRIEPEDEAYWKQHKTTPKAFIRLEDGQAIWGSHYGKLTSMRLRPTEGANLGEVAESFRKYFLSTMPPGAIGLRFEPARERAETSSTSGTDFSQLFLALSFFLIASALLLVAMTYRLALDQRAREAGMLRSLGFSSRLLRTVLGREVAITGVLGTLVGLAVGAAYAGALVWALRTIWSGAVGAPFLTLHVDGTTLGISAAITLILIGMTARRAISRFVSAPPRRLLTGVAENESEVANETGKRSLVFGAILSACAIGALVAGLTRAMALELSFVLLGVSLLGAGLCFFSFVLRRHSSLIGTSGQVSVGKLGRANAKRAPGKSVLGVSLIACATFSVITVAAFHQDPRTNTVELASGNGGFALVARSSSPLHASFLSESG
ncbi:MAG: FtsX-like permease family protein, partial [Planctomycetota bacterium]